MHLPRCLASTLRPRLDGLGAWLAPLGLRVLLAWEYLESGLEKWRGVNWFDNVQSHFPLPLRWLPAEFNWQAATWIELIGGICLLLGVATRATAALLIGLTVVATAAVHWPAQWDSLATLAQGYAISDQGQGNFKLPLLFIAMLLPLLLQGAGRRAAERGWLAAPGSARPGRRAGLGRIGAGRRLAAGVAAAGSGPGVGHSWHRLAWRGGLAPPPWDGQAALLNSLHDSRPHPDHRRAGGR